MALCCGDGTADCRHRKVEVKERRFSHEGIRVCTAEPRTKPFAQYFKQMHMRGDMVQMSVIAIAEGVIKNW